MKTLVTSVALSLALTGAAFAAEGDYDDPGMHFSPPSGWEKITLGPAADAAGQGDDEQERPPVAVYAWHRGQSDQRTIAINIQHYDGSLDAFEHQRESDLRKAADGTFVDKPSKTALANGMPVYLLNVKAGTDVGHFVQRFDYLMIDGSRSIDVSYSGRQGDFGQKDATDAFSSLYVVVYPRHP